MYGIGPYGVQHIVHGCVFDTSTATWNIPGFGESQQGSALHALYIGNAGTNDYVFYVHVDTVEYRTVLQKRCGMALFDETIHTNYQPMHAVRSNNNNKLVGVLRDNHGMLGWLVGLKSQACYDP